MAGRNFILGLDAYIGVLDTTSSVAVTIADFTAADEMTNVKDLTFSMTAQEADISTRANGGWETMAATLKSGTISFQSLFKEDDDKFSVIQDAFFNNTEVTAAVLTKSPGLAEDVGAQGLVGNFVVTQFDLGQQLTEGQMVDITLRPSRVDPDAAGDYWQLEGATGA